MSAHMEAALDLRLGTKGMGKKTVRMNTDGINSLPDNKPVVYKILDNENIYTGVAGKGNVRYRLEDHLPGHKDAVPGAFKVQIDRQSSVRQAERKEDGIYLALQAEVQPAGQVKRTHC